MFTKLSTADLHRLIHFVQISSFKVEHVFAMSSEGLQTMK
jgi:hypothetical protein